MLIEVLKFDLDPRNLADVDKKIESLMLRVVCFFVVVFMFLESSVLISI